MADASTTFSLVPGWVREKTILVPATAGLRLCSLGTHRALPWRTAVARLDDLPHRDRHALRDFLSRARVFSSSLASLDDQAFLARVRAALRTGALLVLEPNAGVGHGKNDTLRAQRRLVRDIDARTRGRLAHGGRQYKLVADLDLDRVPNRSSYEVVSQDEAARVLAAYADANPGPDLVPLLEEAIGKLTRDWRPPLSPDGLVLLRRIPTVSAHPTSQEPALTPSQLLKARNSDWIEIEVVEVFDGEEEPYTGAYRLVLPDDKVVEGDFGPDGFYGNHAIPSGSCQLALRRQPPAQTLAAAPPPAAAEELAEPADEPEVPAEDNPWAETPALPAGKSHYEVKLVDELGVGIPGIAVLFSGAGFTGAGTTDGDGVASCEAEGAGPVTADITDVTSLTERLRERWGQARGVPREQWLKEDGATTVVPYRTDRALEPVTLAAGQPRCVSCQPYVFVARLFGALFDTNKCLLLPTVIPHLQHLKEIYAKTGASKLLVVGHTDVTGDPAGNDPLSLERAQAMVAYLRDDADAWLAFYDGGKPASQRWGKSEDVLMIKSLPEFLGKPKGEDSVKWYQKARGHTVTGSLTQDQRRELITEYMSHDDATLPAGVEPVAHGGGENFPTAQEPPAEQAAWDRHSSIEDRRVELFFFDPGMGIQPPPPGENSGPGAGEYPEWVLRQSEQYDLTADARAKEIVLLEMHDSLFRTDSAVVLPEGEDPTASGAGHLSLSTVGLVAGVLRYNEEHPGRKLLVAGHCDTTATVDYNQTLSEERAAVALACIVGDELRASFAKLCHQRNDGVDKTQVFDWVARQFGWDCAPTRTDAAPSWTTINKFQHAYNLHKSEIKAGGHPDLAEDGDMGEATWGAVFDCYEYALEQELGEDPATVRGKLVWLDDARRSLGFSEYFPVDNLGRDNYRSQSNRRVEVLFFEAGEEPDLDVAATNPEVSEIFLPGYYEREHLPPMLTAKPWDAAWDDTTARMDLARIMHVNARGLPAGVPLTFRVSIIGQGEVATAQAVSVTEAVDCPYQDWDIPDPVPFAGELSAGEEFPDVRYEFVVEGGGRRKQSGNQVTYHDRLTMEAGFNDESGTRFLFRRQRYVLCSPWGRRVGTTDDEGVLDEQRLPPGGAILTLNGTLLAREAERIPQTWDRDEPWT